LAQEAITPISGGDLLVMGHNDEPGCQCVVNHILGSALDAVAAEYDLVIVDNEAGIEQIGRHAWPINFLLLMSSPKPLELDVALQILKRARETQRRIDTPCLILNRAFNGQDYQTYSRQILQGEYTNVAVLGSLPYSQQLALSEEPDDAWLAALDDVWSRLAWLLE
jgi:CO dehydrogenase maturation factor